MDQTTVDLLVHRVEQLERSNRRLKVGGLAGILILTALLLVGWKQVEEELRANVFVTENGYGFLAQGAGGNPWLLLTALNGPNSDIRLATYEDSSLALSLYQNRNAGPRLRAGLSPEGTPAVDLAQPDGDVLMSMRFFEDGSPGFWISNPSSKAYLFAQGYMDGETSIGVWDDLNKPPRVSMGLLPDGTPFIYMRDVNGNIIWSAGSEGGIPSTNTGTTPQPQPNTTLPLPPGLR